MNKKILLLEKKREEVLIIKEMLNSVNINVEHFQTEDLEIEFTSGFIKYKYFNLNIKAYDALYIRTYHQMEILKYFGLMFKGKPIFGVNPLSENFQNNKVADLILLNQYEINVPKTYLNFNPEKDNILKKGNWGYGGFDVNLYQNEDLDIYKEHLQEYIDVEGGSDWRVLLINGKSVPFIIERFPSEGDFRTNVHQGGKTIIHLENHPLFKEITNIAEKAGKILDRMYAGVDLRVDKSGKIYVLEVNRTPRLRFDGEAKEIYFKMLKEDIKSRI